jgi:hypothetical protein
MKTPEIFSYPEIIEKPKFLDTINHIRKEYESYSSYIIHLEKGMGAITPLLLLYCPVLEKGVNIHFQFQDRDDIVVPLDYVNLFCNVYKKGMIARIFMSLMNLASRGHKCEKTYLDYKVPSKKPFEDGQAKIMVSTLIPLVASEPEVHILVIGSSSEDVGQKTNPSAGRSYEALVDFLPKMGYNGSMTLYDPYEQPRRFETEGFVVESRREKFDYNIPIKSCTGKDFTHIYDDVWMVTKINPVVRRLEYDKVVMNLEDVVCSKFAYSIKIQNHTKYLFFTNNLKKHSDLEGACGGGMIQVHGKRILIYGSSNRVPHYDKKLIQKIFAGYDLEVRDDLRVGRLTWDPGNNLYKHYPNAIISAKYFGEDYTFFNGPKTIYDQIWYNGAEKRIVVNKIIKNVGYWKGCGCVRCKNYAIIINGLVNHRNTDYTLTRQLLNSVIADKCIACHTSTLTRALNIINSFGHSRNSDYDLITLLSNRLGITALIAYRYLMFAIRFKKTNIVLKELRQLSTYNHEVVLNKEIRLYRDPGLDDYYVFRDGILAEHYVDGKLKVNEVVYRVSSVSMPIEKVITEIIIRHKSDILYVDGYPKICGDGDNVVGFDSTYEYFLSVDDRPDCHLLDYEDRWKLYFNVEFDTLLT